MGASDDEQEDAVHPADGLLKRALTPRPDGSNPPPSEDTSLVKEKKKRRGRKRSSGLPEEGLAQDAVKGALDNGQPTIDAAKASDGSDEGAQDAKRGKGTKRRRDDYSEATPLDRPTNGEVQATDLPKRLPRGAVLVDNATPVSDEMISLVRKQRYFDDDYEAAAIKCFHCGGSGHMARDCNNAGKMRPCHMCAQFHGHIRCPNTLCYRCNRPGHVSRDCPYKGVNPQVVCLRCGQLECSGAGDDMARAEGACSTPYSEGDMRYVRCAVCEGWGHMSCKAATAPPLKPSCANCGERGHTWEACRQDLQRTVETERQINRSRQYATPAVAATPTMQYGANGQSLLDRYGYTGPSSAPDFPRGNSRHVYFDNADTPPTYAAHAPAQHARRHSADNGQYFRQSYQAYQTVAVQQYNYANPAPYGGRQYDAPAQYGTPGQYGVPPNYQANGYARQQWGDRGGGGYASPYADQGYEAQEQSRARKRQR